VSNITAVTSVACALVSLIACGGRADLGTDFTTAHDGGEPPALGPRTAEDALSCQRPNASSPTERWLRNVGDDHVFELSSIASDAEGNAFLARSAGETLKFDPNGTLLWSRHFGSHIAVKGDTNVTVAGTFTGTLDLGVTTLTSGGGSDVYVVELDTNGDVLYASALGGPDDEVVSGLAVDGAGNALVSGAGLGTVKLDANGASVWKRDLYGHVAVDSRGNVLVGGSFTGTLDFGGGPLTSAGGEDIFVAKLDAAGNHVFSRRFGDADATQRAEAIAVDPGDNVLVSGVFEGTVDFGAGPLSLEQRSCPSEVPCKRAGFVVKLDAGGRHVFGLVRGPMRSLSGIASDSRGNVLVSGASPGGVPPYVIPLLVQFDADGKELWKRTEWPQTGIGAGHRVTADPCDAVLWSLSVRPTLDTDERAYLAKITP